MQAAPQQMNNIGLVVCSIGPALLQCHLSTGILKYSVGGPNMISVHASMHKYILLLKQYPQILLAIFDSFYFAKDDIPVTIV